MFLAVLWTDSPSSSMIWLTIAVELNSYWNQFVKPAQPSSNMTIYVWFYGIISNF